MKKQMIDALKSKYEADYKQAKITLDVYLKNSVGIGEHPQIFDEMDKLVDSMACAKDKLEALKSEYDKGEKQFLNESYGGTDPE
tara:strand:+ start:108 stop:359 length:252 start_codon:yes stop_codon:yes gene_type:complete